MDVERLQLLQELWKGMLKPLQLDLANSVLQRLPPYTTDFLIRVGLPLPSVLFQYERSLAFALQPHTFSSDFIKDYNIWQVTPVFYNDEPVKVVYDKDYLVIGKRGQADIGLRVETGQVMLITTDKAFYLNTSIDRYVYAIHLYLECKFDLLYNSITELLLTGYVPHTQESGSNQVIISEYIKARYAKLIDDLTSDDPSIIHVDNSWWVAHISQSQLGL